MSKGSSALRLEVVEGPQSGMGLDLEGPVIVGRSSSRSTFVLKDSEASRRHASLIPQGQSVNVQDLGSTNGTFVNEERIDERRMVEVGDRLRIGTTVIEVRPGPGVKEPAAPGEAEEEPAPAADEEAEPVAEADEPESEEAAEPEPEEEDTGETAVEAAAEDGAPDQSSEEAAALAAITAAVEAGELAKRLHGRLQESFSDVLHA